MKIKSGTTAVIMVLAVLLGTSIMAMSSKAGKKAGDGRFIAYDDGTVLDTRTNLMWAAADNGAEITWQDANSYCENYRAGGYTDWRLPTLDELEGLYDADKYRPAACSSDIDLYMATELIDITCSRVWASERRDSEAANFSFSIGVRHWNSPSYVNSRRALPVRSGE